MKICFLADAKSIHTQKWVSYFAERGHEVHLISKSFIFPRSDIKLHFLGRFPESNLTLPINTLYTILQIKNIIRKINPDIVHAHYILDYGFYGALTGFHPLVETAWGSDVLLNSSWTTKYALKKADVITCDGLNSKVAIVEMGTRVSGSRTLDEKIEIISHGVDTNKFRPIEESSREPTIISTRSLKSIYDVSTFIRSIPMVLKSFPDARFVVVGDGPEKGFLIRMADLSGVSNSVDFVGSVPSHKIPECLSSAGIYVSTSFSDGGIAVSTLEAMSSGLAPISTDVGDVRDWISDGINGFVVPTKDPVILAEQIVYLLQNRNVLKEFGIKSREIVQERADYYKEMGKVEKIYEGLIK